MDRHHQPTPILGNPHPLQYTIHSCSSCSPVFHPFNIIEDCPTDSSSRWSGSGPPNPSIRPNPSSSQTGPSDIDHQHDPSTLVYAGQLPKRKEYIIIDLGRPCVVRSVTFGKYHRPHPCNIKLFRIWGSLSPGEGKGDFKALLDQPTQVPNASTSDTHDSLSQYVSRSATQTGSLSSKQKDPLLGVNRDDRSGSGGITSRSQSSSRAQAHQRVRVRGERDRSGPRMELLAQGELKNDPLAETVQLRWRNNHVAWFNTSASHEYAHDEPHAQSAGAILPSRSSGIIIPVRYLKLEPLSAAGSNYNCSIWHVSVSGHDEDHIVLPAVEKYEKWRASAALRLCLKHLRQTGHTEAFEALLKSSAHPSHSPTLVPPPSDTFVSRPSYLTSLSHHSKLKKASSEQFYFEHSLVSALHDALIPSGLSCDQSSSSHPHNTLQKAEEIVRRAALEGLFDEWSRGEAPSLTCHQLHSSFNLLEQSPGPRGGHQMCIDTTRRKIWLFGGFDGYSELSDLWIYHLPPLESEQDEDGVSGLSNGKEKMRIGSSGPRSGWQLVSPDVKKQGGPMNRSCHQMVLDERTGELYVMGRYSERIRIQNRSTDSPVAKSTHDYRSNQLLSVSSTHNPSGTHSEPQPMALDRDPMLLPDRFHNGVLPRISSGSRSRPTIREPGRIEEGDVEGTSSADQVMTDVEPLLDTPTSTTGHYKNDFFRFSPYVDASGDQLLVSDGQIGRWECISRDTQVAGGPKLIFDHQMVLDSDARKIYVFGGKVIQPNQSSIFHDSSGNGLLSSQPQNQYSGLYEYDLGTATWSKLMSDPASSSTSEPFPNSANHIPSRMGHALMLDKKRQSLWILTGERDGHYYSDLWRYHLPSRTSERVSADYTQAREDWNMGGSGVSPEAGFSQRTTFDAARDEWHMFCGLCRDRGAEGSNKSEMMSSEFWRWRISEGKWTRVVMMAEDGGNEAPPPRFAHQMVFDDLANNHYVFGGNPADSDHEPVRLGDFWRLKLAQATPNEALRRCLFGLRRQQFIEMCTTADVVSALTYLQVDLSAVTNHMDEHEARQFRACTAYLLTTPQEESDEDDGWEAHGECGIGENWIYQRTKLFEGLLKYFPKSMTEPEESLVNLVDVWGDRETFW
ncbi:hypothetical protein CROQUDRAFT_654483 [Cronartium quercuum f. sp. fusiforme G11]|uniref:Muskelin N-terminal domain-containing protein n=1 Tax=Cronartium quercuum f. sp. fusiforme G11 TaxID=708437 RepID=A0A9P6NSD3_9BASI|nr:hypothetical protein CROQUDRAFT_654483 [Cronartium quercuum f. sp. fusiforme G11]